MRCSGPTADLDDRTMAQPTFQTIARAIEVQDREAVLSWLASGGDANAQDEKGRTPLMLAAGNGSFNITEELIARGADLEVHQHQGTTALMFAAFAGEARIVQILLGARALADARDTHGLSAEDYARLHSHKEVIQLLQPVELPETILEAAQAGDFDAVQRYLSEGSSVDAKDSQLGGTMLMCAATSGHSTMLEFLHGVRCGELQHTGAGGVPAAAGKG
jgi:ankyrin repeat protein